MKFSLYKTIRFIALTSMCMAAVHLTCGRASAQEAADGASLVNQVVERWEIGVEITPGGGSASGLVATTPIPIDWPEQTVKVISEDISNNVRRVSYKTLNETVKQMNLSVAQLRGEETARAVLTIEITKRFIEEPEDTAQFQFAKTIPRDVRKYLLPSPFIESRHLRIKKIADTLGNENDPAWNQVEEIFQWVRDNVEYKFDEKIKTCVAALDSHQGDCEELSSLFIAICRAKGIPARAVWIPGHTYPEFYLNDAQGKGHWFPCQAAGEYQFGRMYETKPVIQKGDNFRIAGLREPLRYVRPTLTARNTTAAPVLKWIIRKIETPQ